jgi:hypothetical protein
VDRPIHVFLNLFVGHVAAALLSFDLVPLPETPHQQLPNRLRRKLIGRPVFSMRGLFKFWKQVVGDGDVRGHAKTSISGF